MFIAGVRIPDCIAIKIDRYILPEKSAVIGAEISLMSMHVVPGSTYVPGFVTVTTSSGGLRCLAGLFCAVTCAIENKQDNKEKLTHLLLYVICQAGSARSRLCGHRNRFFVFLNTMYEGRWNNCW